MPITKLTYPVRPAAAVGFTLFLAGSLLAPASSAPITQTGVDGAPWWHSPCSNPNYNKCNERANHHPLRHHPGELATIITAIKNAFLDVNQSIHSVMYNDILNQIPENQFNTNWLPKRHWKDYAADKHGKKDSLSEFLPKFHKELQFYAATFERLASVELHSEITDDISRNRSRIMRATIEKMRQILCEVETSFNSSCMGKIPRLETNDMVQIAAQMTMRISMTHIRNQDVTILIKYRDSLADWTKIIRHEKKYIKCMQGKGKKCGNLIGKKRAKQKRRRLRKQKGKRTLNKKL